MHALRNARRIGRALAAWLLLWFCAMAAPTPTEAQDLAPVGLMLSDETPCEGGNGHQAHRAGTPGPLHSDRGGHPDGSSQHCPLCMHAAAPPLGWFTLGTDGAAPAEQPGPAAQAPLRVRTDTPPPSRAPPTFS